MPVNLCLSAKYVAWFAPLGSAFVNVVYSQNKIIVLEWLGKGEKISGIQFNSTDLHYYFNTDLECTIVSAI